MRARMSARAAWRVGVGVLGVLGAWAVWRVSLGGPDTHAGWMRPGVRQAGRTLFTHEWQPRDPLTKGDGLGPVFNARSCVACHSQGGVGGGGGRDANVAAFQVMPSTEGQPVRIGMVHKFAVEPGDRETGRQLQAAFPALPRGPMMPDFDPVRVEPINSTALFGAGRIDTISGGEVVALARRQRLATLRREVGGDFRGAVPGRARVLPDGRIGKFGWKAQFATLEEFVASACANEIGLGNPLVEQARPLGRRFEAPPAADLDAGQVRTLVAFVGLLPRPVEMLPPDTEERVLAERGKAAFRAVGCAECHTPDVGGVTGVYSDFLLHDLRDRRSNGGPGYGPDPEAPPVAPPEGHPRPEEWRTPPLWGVADSAPYFHDGAAPTLEDAILRHKGDAHEVTEAFNELSARDRRAVVAFLKALRAPTDAEPAPADLKGRIASSR